MSTSFIRRARVGAAALGLAVLGTVPAAAETGGTQATQPAPSQAPVTPETQPVALTRAQARSLQRRVHVHADGAIGTRTRRAIRRYQTRARLARTGRPNLQTLRALRLPFADEVAVRVQGPAAPAPPAPGSAAGAVAAARGQIGAPYVRAGERPGGFDCSGLTMWAFAQVGIALPHSSFEQYGTGRPVAANAIAPGDLVFFDSAGPGASDVGIATSATTVISATTHGVREHAIHDGYWGTHHIGTRRLAG
jgi:cell wall-associated NlpC family hydrolase